MHEESFSRHIPEPNKEFDPMYIQQKTLTDEYNELKFPMKDLQDALDLKSRQRKEQETQDRLRRKAKEDEERRLRDIQRGKERERNEIAKQIDDYREYLFAWRYWSGVVIKEKNFEEELSHLEIWYDNSVKRIPFPLTHDSLTKIYDEKKKILEFRFSEAGMRKYKAR